MLRYLGGGGIAASFVLPFGIQYNIAHTTVLEFILDPSNHCKVERDDRLLRAFDKNLSRTEATVLKIYDDSWAGTERMFVLYMPNIKDSRQLLAISHRFGNFLANKPRTQEEDIDVWVISPSSHTFGRISPAYRGFRRRIV